MKKILWIISIAALLQMGCGEDNPGDSGDDTDSNISTMDSDTNTDSDSDTDSATELPLGFVPADCLEAERPKHECQEDSLVRYSGEMSSVDGGCLFNFEIVECPDGCVIDPERSDRCWYPCEDECLDPPDNKCIDGQLFDFSNRFDPFNDTSLLWDCEQNGDEFECNYYGLPNDCPTECVIEADGPDYCI